MNTVGVENHEFMSRRLRIDASGTGGMTKLNLEAKSFERDMLEEVSIPFLLSHIISMLCCFFV
jgi:hypothetical protein